VLCISPRLKKSLQIYFFLESSDDIENDVSFEEIGFSSIDFIDFCYEVKAQINPGIEPHDIWPFSRLLIDPHFYTEGCWTDAGKKLLMTY